MNPAHPILVVDDVATNRHVLRAVLEDEGWGVLEAADGLDALDRLRQGPVSVVISDILMPNLDGLALCEAIRADPALAGTPFIAYSNTYDSDWHRAQALGRGADAVIIKPAPVEQILAAVREHADRAVRPIATAPPAATRPAAGMRLYDESLIARLEERNSELAAARRELADANGRITALNAELAARVRHTGGELARSTTLLSHRNEQIEAFYHTLSHELKTPLTSARELLALVEDGVAGPTTDQQRELLALARESCDQMRRCLDDLVDASRLETGKLSLKRAPASLPDVIRSAARAVEPLYRTRRLDIDVDPGEDLPRLDLDVQRIVQVVTNLLNNAAKHSPDEASVSLRLRRVAGGQRVSVRDNGPGIPVELQHRIFDRLYQIHTGDAATEHGMGLGLFLCRELVELHGGRIGVDSRPGAGSEFWFVLPDTSPSPASAVHH